MLRARRYSPSYSVHASRQFPRQIPETFYALCMDITYRALTPVDAIPVGGHNGVPMGVGAIEFHAVCVVDGQPRARTLCHKIYSGSLSGDFADLAIDQVCKICDAAYRR